MVATCVFLGGWSRTAPWNQSLGNSHTYQEVRTGSALHWLYKIPVYPVLCSVFSSLFETKINRAELDQIKD